MKSIKCVTASFILASSLVAFATPSYAADKESVAKSEGDIYYEKNDDKTDTVNPVDPEKEIEEKPGTGEKGPLSIDYISSLHFSKQKVSGSAKRYFALPDTVTEKGTGVQTEVPNYVQVTDNRGTGAGWNLKVKQDQQFEAVSAKKSKLKGARLTFNNGTPRSSNLNSLAPTTFKSVTLPLDDTSNTGSYVLVMDAKKTAGIGTWVDAFDPNTDGTNGVQLDVPAGLTIEQSQYKTSLTWQLSATAE
ncbi:WxL domain-containing protein [Vagococcus salmoninarum]|uniref:WxL domain-containing protein n=1 Tax=Vagococcus salmoninarum TaxID=2739 RepID=UPI003F95A48E